MFGWSKKEKKAKLLAEYQKGVNDILLRANAGTPEPIPYGRGTAYGNGGYQSADTLHDVYVDFGYPVDLDFWNYFRMYERFGPALAVIDIPINLSWMKIPEVKGSPGFESKFEELVKKTHFWKRIKGWDNYQRVGRYAGLFMQVKDDKAPHEEIEMLGSVESILNLIPIYEGNLKILDTDSDIKSDNFGKPIMYQFCPAGFNAAGDPMSVNADNATYDIHPSRIEIAAEGSFDGTLNGRPVLKSVFNDLQDLQKISGAGGEGFYQNARNNPIINIPDSAKAPTGDAKDALKCELEDHRALFQKKFIAVGMEFIFPNISLDAPKEFSENSKNNVAAGSGIAAAIIFGQQMGVRAADKDFDMLMMIIQSRRDNHCDEIVKNEIDWMIARGVLPNEEYEVEWDDMTAATEEEKLKLAEIMMGVNEKAMRGQVEPVFDAGEAREAAGFDNKTIERVEGDLDELKDENEQ